MILMPTTKVQKTPTGQFVITIPKKIAENAEITKEDEIYWPNIKKGSKPNKILIEIIRQEDFRNG